MRPGYLSLSACSSTSFSNRLQFSCDLFDPFGPELHRHSRLADIDFVDQQFQDAALLLGVQNFPDWIQPL